MAPVVPSVATVRFGTVVPAIQLRSDARGRVAVDGYTVRKLAAVVLVTVTFRMAPETPVAGTPPTPRTWTSSVPPAASVLPALGWPLPTRVSVIRAGVNPTCPPAVLVPPATK